jgi:hypothetical protein
VHAYYRIHDEKLVPLSICHSLENNIEYGSDTELQAGEVFSLIFAALEDGAKQLMVNC